MPPKTPKAPKNIESLKHEEAKRTNIPTAEHQSVMTEADKHPIRVAFARRDPDLDPQLIWRGKDLKNWSEVVVNAPPLYIQEKIHPKVLIDDLKGQSEGRQDTQLDLFADFNGLPKDATATEFYQHQANWTNRMILGNSLQVMASLAEREGLRGKVQCIYIDPPYGIRFDSNFQWSTTTYKVIDGKQDQITREPEQVKAFRDTWRDGIHSYLTYLRDRLTVARDLLSDSGSIFVQIGDENLHRIRVLLDEVFGESNFFSLITLRKLSPLGTGGMANITDYIIWYSKDKDKVKFRPIFETKRKGLDSRYTYAEMANSLRRSLTKDEVINLDNIPSEWKLFTPSSMLSSGFTQSCTFDFKFQGKLIPAQKRSWRTNKSGIDCLINANRLTVQGKLPYLVAYYEDNPLQTMDNIWTDSGSASTSYEKIYVVQTSTRQLQKCMLMATDPGDLVLDPTCGSGTTAYVAEQWGRRWITIDTSRVALALARARIMGARYPYYLLADSKAGQKKEAEVTRTFPSDAPTHNNVRQGFVYERVPHITLKSIANNAEIDVIWEKYQPQVQEALDQLNAALKGHKTPYKVTTGGREGKLIKFTETGTVKLPSGEEAPANALLEWEVPREAPSDWSDSTHAPLEQFWKARIARQKEIDASIAAKADQEFLYDKPYEDKNIVRVAGPFTVESLSPHRVLVVDEDDELVDPNAPKKDSGGQDFAEVIIETLKVAGVQQADKAGKIDFTSLVGWPGVWICAEGRYLEGETERRAGVFIGPEFGTVSRPDLVAAAREAGDAGFDVVIACAFSYDAQSTEFNKLGRIPILKARMNADLHMANDLKDTKAANLFCIFGEPDIDLLHTEDDRLQVKLHGVDVFHPSTGEVRSSNADEIACWFIDTDYNEESFFVRHAYFLGANDPYKSLKTTLKAEIDEEAWESLHSDTSRPFDKPKSGRIAVKVINHLGDEVMKVFSVS